MPKTGGMALISTVVDGGGGNFHVGGEEEGSVGCIAAPPKGVNMFGVAPKREGGACEESGGGTPNNDDAGGAPNGVAVVDTPKRDVAGAAPNATEGPNGEGTVGDVEEPPKSGDDVNGAGAPKGTVALLLLLLTKGTEK